MSSDKERLRKALDAMIYLPHLKDRQARSTVSALLPGEGAPGGAGRPWDRGDLFRRLQTFRAATWFAKPGAISAVECARRGWANAEADLVRCESCHAAVACPLAPELSPAEADQAAGRYARQLTEAHAAACPWRSASCSLSLLQFPELPRGAVLLDFNDRAAALRRLLCLPPIAGDAVAALAEGPGQRERLARLLRHGPQQRDSDDEPAQAPASEPAGAAAAAAAAGLLASLSEGTAACDADAFAMRLRLLALCGWDLRVMSTAAGGAAEAGASPDAARRAQLPTHVGPESAALACTLCGARAGLWGSFPACEARVHVAPRASRQAAAWGGSGGMQSPGAAHAMSRHVAADMSTTIAGGSMPEGGGAAAGPASPPSAAAAAAPFGSARREASGNGGGMPVFGFAALRAGEPSGGTGAAGAGGKRHRDAFLESIAGAGAAADKRRRPSSPPGAAPPAGPAPAEALRPSPAVLQRYRSMPSTPLHPLDLHRAFCPWAHSPAVGGDQGGQAGWEWCLRQLVPGDGGGGGGGEGPAAGAPGGGDAGGARPPAWDPAAMLRNALSRVEVTK